VESGGCALVKDKIHLLTTDDTPFRDHSDVLVPCGMVVKDAIKGMTWDAQSMGTLPEYPLFNVCKKCRDIAAKSENEGRQFVIAVVTAGAANQQ
jgi:hypothetical protein